MAIFPEEMAMTKKTQATDRERRWRETFERFARSGLNVRAFCRQESLPESAFYFWRRELARRDGEIPGQPKSRRPRTPRRQAKLPEFLPVQVIGPSAPSTGLALELAGGYVLRLPESISAVRLAEIVAALTSRSAP